MEAMYDREREERAARLQRDLTAAKFVDGAVVSLKRSGTRYRLANMHKTTDGPQGTLLRETPKIRGKAARRADKRARRGQGLL